jgi:transcriptional regulator with XRE-family HTH domain
MDRWLLGDWDTLGDMGGGVVASARGVFAANLRRRREEIGLSQHDLAALTGLDRTEISLLERGLRSPLLDTIVVLSSALELDSHGALLEETDLAENRPIARTAGFFRQ